MEVQTLLVSGRKKDALHCAQQGQLWGPALVLAAQLGDQVCLDVMFIIFLTISCKSISNGIIEMANIINFSNVTKK